MDGSLTDWKQIPDWDEALAARPYELGHLSPPVKVTTSYSDAHHMWVEHDITSRSEHDVAYYRARKGAYNRARTTINTNYEGPWRD